MGEIISLNNRPLPGTTPKTQQQPSKTPAPAAKPYKPAAVVYTEQRYRQICFVCGRETAQQGNYCSRHPRQKFRWVACSVEGCNRVTERKMYGHNLFICPEHSGKPAPRPQMVSSPMPAELKARLQASRQAKQQQALAQSFRPRRPPFNIGKTI